MSLSDRLRRAEQDLRGAASGSSCATCGYPSPYGRGYAVAASREALPKCPDCGQPVDETGFTLPMLSTGGRAWLKIRIREDTDLPS